MYYINSNNNVKIFVEDIYPEGKKTILFIHGWPLNRKIFEYQFNILPYHGFRCISLDLRGFGNSDVTANGYSYDNMSNDIYNLINNLNVRSLILVGFSMGGAIAIRYMKLFNGYKVSKLSLLAAAAPSFVQTENYSFGMKKEDLNGLIKNLYKNRPKTVIDFGKNFFNNSHGSEFNNWFNGISLSSSGNGTIETAKSLRDEDLRGDLKYINVPTGIFHGEKDKICPYRFALEMNKGIKNSKLFPFPNSGHGIFYDELDKFNKTFLDYINS